MTESILNDSVERLEVGVTDGYRGIIIEAGEFEAVYEAEHARRLADAMEERADEYEIDPSKFIEYLRELAELVDDEKSAEEVVSEWKDRDLNE